MAAFAAAPLGFLATYAPVILTAGAGLLSARNQYIAGKEAKHATKLEAKQEVDAARSREIDRKRNLLRALATQNAAAGAQGVAFSGGKAALAQYDVNEAVSDMRIDRANLSRRALMLKNAGKSANKQGKMGAVTSLLDTAGNVFEQL